MNKEKYSLCKCKESMDNPWYELLWPALTDYQMGSICILKRKTCDGL